MWGHFLWCRVLHDCSVPAALSWCPHVGERRVQFWSLLTTPNTSGCIKHQLERLRAALSFPPHAPQKICWRWKDAAVVRFCREATRCSTSRGKQEAAVWLWRFSCREEAGGTEPNCKNTSVISVQGHTGCFCVNIMYKAVFCPRLSREAVKHWRVQLTDIRRSSINTGSCSWRLNVLQTSSRLYINLLVPTWITPCTFTCTLMNWSLSDLWIYQIIQVVMKTA